MQHKLSPIDLLARRRAFVEHCRELLSRTGWLSERHRQAAQTRYGLACTREAEEVRRIDNGPDAGVFHLLRSQRQERLELDQEYVLQRLRENASTYAGPVLRAISGIDMPPTMRQAVVGEIERHGMYQARKDAGLFLMPTNRALISPSETFAGYIWRQPEFESRVAHYRTALAPHWERAAAVQDEQYRKSE